MKILITGGSGFFGLHLIKKLISSGHGVRNLDLADINDTELERSVEFIKADVRDKAAVDRAAEGAEIVFHNAAILPVSRSKKKIFWDINVRGTEIVLDSCVKNEVRKVIFISSSAPYGIPKSTPITEMTGFNPVEDYGRSKIAAEDLCRRYKENGLDISILRPRTIVGAGRLGIFQILYSWISDGNNVYIIGKGDNLFQLLSSDDLAQACLLAIEKPCRNEDFNIGAESYGTVRQDLESLIAYARTRSRVVSIPAGIAKSALFILDKMNLSPLGRWHYLTPDKPFYFDITKAKTVLGFRPKHSNIEMFKKSYDWYISNRSSVDTQFGITHRKSTRQRILRVLKKIS